jgi:hypothetical protein
MQLFHIVAYAQTPDGACLVRASFVKLFHAVLQAVAVPLLDRRFEPHLDKMQNMPVDETAENRVTTPEVALLPAPQYFPS